MSVGGRRTDLSAEMRWWRRIASGILPMYRDWWRRLVLGQLLGSGCLCSGWCGDRRRDGVLFDN
jgi:hypothetical protein